MQVCDAVGCLAPSGDVQPVGAGYEFCSRHRAQLTTPVEPGAVESVTGDTTNPPRAIPPDVDAALANRYSYHAPTGDQPERYALIRRAVLDLARMIALYTPVSREQSTAYTALDTVMFNANAAIARNG